MGARARNGGPHRARPRHVRAAEERQLPELVQAPHLLRVDHHAPAFQQFRRGAPIAVIRIAPRDPFEGAAEARIAHGVRWQPVPLIRPRRARQADDRARDRLGHAARRLPDERHLGRHAQLVRPKKLF